MHYIACTFHTNDSNRSVSGYSSVLVVTYEFGIYPHVIQEEAVLVVKPSGADRKSKRQRIQQPTASWLRSWRSSLVALGFRMAWPKGYALSLTPYNVQLVPEKPIQCGLQRYEHERID
jgi:hypothetical protein